MRLTASVVAAVLVGAALPLAVAAPASAEDYLCSQVDVDTAVSGSSSRSTPYALLGVGRATELLAERGIKPGQGVTVAVVDSGVEFRTPPLAPITVSGRQSFGTSGPVVDGHGAQVAGLIAAGERTAGGATGIAPAATIVDIRVYEEAGENGVGGIDPDNVIDALRWLADNAKDAKIGVVVMAFSLPPTSELERAVAALSRRDVVIVAGSGNRPEEEGQSGFEEFGEQSAGEDAAGTVYPAAYAEDVFAVTTTAEGMDVEEGETADASGAALFSSDIDAAVPTAGAITLSPNGGTCLVDQITTSWAAGIAAGVVALVRSAYPRENADQIEARLLASASGTLGSRTTATGAGVLQPVEALTQELDPTRAGETDDMPRESADQPRVTAPRPEVDPVATTLTDARWLGLFAGAGLVIALLVRPLLRRRRVGAEETGGG